MASLLTGHLAFIIANENVGYIIVYLKEISENDDVIYDINMGTYREM